MPHCIRLALIVVCFAAPAMAQVKGPVAPALTPEQIALSKSLALKFDEGPAKEQRRLATFANRPLGGVIQRSFNIESNYLAMAAQMMPESSYGFRPTPEVRTFGEQITHAAATQYSFCNQVGLPPGVQRETMVRPLPTSKDAIVAAYKASSDYCSRVLAAAPESWLMEIVPAVGGPSSGQIQGARAHIFIYNALHTTDDYGTITTYLRMQGVVPPSSALEPPPAPARGSGPQ
jgi:uncharacterized damage-inducible protein DinB